MASPSSRNLTVSTGALVGNSVLHYTLIHLPGIAGVILVIASINTNYHLVRGVAKY